MKRLGVVAVEDGVALTSAMQHTQSLRPVSNQKTILPKYYSADTHYDQQYAHKRRGGGQFRQNSFIISNQILVYRVHPKIITLFWCFLLLIQVTHNRVSSF